MGGKGGNIAPPLNLICVEPTRFHDVNVNDLVAAECGGGRLVEGGLGGAGLVAQPLAVPRGDGHSADQRRGACQPDLDPGGPMLAAVRGSQRSNHPAPLLLTCNIQAPDLFVH